MAANTTPLSSISRSTANVAAKLAKISVDSAERTIAVQLEYTKGAIAQATLNAQAISGAKDVHALMALPARIAENALENFIGYSRSLYEVASEAQGQYSRLAEERMGEFQQAVTQSVEEAARTSPAGGDVAIAAMKSQLAATTAAFDTFNKAARNMASLADAGVAASRPARTARRK